MTDKLKEMSIEDLLTHLIVYTCFGVLSYDKTDEKGLPYKTEIRERFANLENRLENVSKECEVCPDKKDLRQQVINLEKQVESLKCCGNCIHKDTTKLMMCEHTGLGRAVNQLCNYWQPDGLTKEERTK